MKNVIRIHNRCFRSVNGAIVMGVRASDFPPPEPRHYFTQQETASLLHVDVRTVRRWTRKGKLKACQFGQRVFFERLDLIRSILNFNL